MTGDSVPMFRVHVEGEDGMTVLLPEFDIGDDLNAEQRRAYAALCKIGQPHQTGAIGVSQMAEHRFENGERVSLIHAGRRYNHEIGEQSERLSAVADAGRETVEAYRRRAERADEIARWARQAGDSVETEQ